MVAGEASVEMPGKIAITPPPGPLRAVVLLSRRKRRRRILLSRYGLFRRHAERAREALAIMRPDLGIDDPRRSLAVERVKNLLGGDAAHVLARLAGDACGVRARQHIVELQQGVLGRRRLLRPDVEAGAGDALILQGLQQCVLVVDEAARGG